MRRGGVYIYPSESNAREMVQGALIEVQVSRAERDPAARKRCIEIFGAVCQVCGFDFAKRYREIGAGFIHIHHLFPLKASKGERKVNPYTDLCPVCPNCHEMLHRKYPPYALEDLKAAISRVLT